MSKRLKRFLVFSLGLLPLPAFADSDAAVSIIGNLCTYLSSTPAVAVAVLAVIYSGYEMLAGKLSKSALVIRCLGVGVIIGASYYGKTILLNGVSP